MSDLELLTREEPASKLRLTVRQVRHCTCTGKILESGSGTALPALGLRLSDSRDLSPANEFVAIGKAIGNLADPAKRAQEAVALFGKSGGKLLTLFADPTFGAGNVALQKQAELLDRDASRFDNIPI